MFCPAGRKLKLAASTQLSDEDSKIDGRVDDVDGKFIKTRQKGRGLEAPRSNQQRGHKSRQRMADFNFHLDGESQSGERSCAGKTGAEEAARPSNDSGAFKLHI